MSETGRRCREESNSADTVEGSGPAAAGNRPNADMEVTSQWAGTSNSALAKLAPRVQWEHSYVAANKTFCVYLAEDEEAIREHAKISGFPATTITEVKSVIDPTTAA